LIAHSFDVGFINNLMARFWLAPVTGIRLSRVLLNEEKATDFRSNYATTGHLTDIHEFGYFWRHWLKKETLSDFVHAHESEQDIDWLGLKRALLNMQHEFAKPMVFKNIFGAYHIKRFVQLLSRVLFVYIERDHLDNAISILEARRKFYTDLNLWWSTCPIEYEQLKDLPHMAQIAGQVHYLRKYYAGQIEAVDGQHVIRINYRDLCEDTLGALRMIQSGCREYCGYEMPVTAAPPPRFEYRQHLDRTDLRDQFRRIADKLAGLEP
jgi:hypothetical protein